MNIKKALKICQDFADEHDIVFEKSGEVGFGRKCVGFMSGDCYIAHNPYDINTYGAIPEYKDDRLYPPEGVDDAYHKTDCLAVLGHGNGAIIQLATWIEYLKSFGKVKIVEYNTKAKGLQIMFSGVIGKCVVIHES